jgi:rod shape-determining protein MreB
VGPALDRAGEDLAALVGYYLRKRTRVGQSARLGRVDCVPRHTRRLSIVRPRFSSSFRRGLAVDALVYLQGHGIVLDEPSVVAIDLRDGSSIAVGSEAKAMIGRAPAHIQLVRLLRDAVIADFEICEKMLAYFVRRARPSRLSKPDIVICVPSGVTGVEKRAVMDAAEAAGARRAWVIEEPMAAAIGAGLPVHEPTGNMVVDMGGGTSEVAVRHRDQPVGPGRRR